ncbi:Fc receptor, IgE, high affinity I, gamma polypeptide like [Gadus chalcogrammus]|uniref:Fc receptor, IgE, high affinity I, gamma polypeptide like n=1 Tax=Gadus chalcogrammus TaxID=1042646 RepID=UPI0024C4E227|nr:Fc receptor, IgE, high affinity I, gamma polypeptide like [Gadus chalcogrammus]
MTTMMRGSLLAVLLMVNLSCVDAFDDMKVCYVLDAILIAYSIVLTVLYIRLKLYPATPPQDHPEKSDAAGIYSGLTPHISDTYETIRVEKKAQM